MVILLYLYKKDVMECPSRTSPMVDGVPREIFSKAEVGTSWRS